MDKEKIKNYWKSEVKKHLIYCYIDEETKSVYVGLTNNIVRRKREHITGKVKKQKRNFDTVYNYFHSKNKEIPEPIILLRNIDCMTAREAEKFYVNLYKLKGYNILNKAKAGSLGGLTNVKYDEELIRKIVATNNYNSVEEFKLHNPSACMASYRLGIIDKLNLKRNRKLTKKVCIEICKKYQSRGEIQKGDMTLYNKMLNNNWFDECPWLKEPLTVKKYTKEECNKIRMSCKTRAEFKRINQRAYHISRINGWNDEWFPENVCKRPIIQYDLNGNYIKEWESISEAIRFIGVNNNTCICKCCNGKLKTAYGYIWKYKDVA